MPTFAARAAPRRVLALLAAGEPEPAAQRAGAHQVITTDEDVLQRGQLADEAEILKAARDAAAGELA